MRVSVRVSVIVFAVGMITVACRGVSAFSLHPGTWIEAGMWSGSFSLVRVDDKDFPSFTSFMKTVETGGNG